MLNYNTTQSSHRLCPLHICQVPISLLGTVELSISTLPRLSSKLGPSAYEAGTVTVWPPGPMYVRV